MEAREEPRDPGYDDWFDEPEPPSETQSGANRGVYEDVEEVWVLPEDEEPRTGQREIVIAGRTLTVTQVAIIALSVLAIFFFVLAVAGVFNGHPSAAPSPLPTVTRQITVTAPATTGTATPKAQAPSQPLSPGATGSQVKTLQRALAALGFSPGTPDGDYGPSTQAAVEQFQTSKGLTPDGVVGAVTLAALQKALAG